MTVKMVQDYGSVSSEMSSQNERNVVDLNVTKISGMIEQFLEEGRQNRNGFPNRNLGSDF